MKALIQRTRKGMLPLLMAVVMSINPINAYAGCSACWWSGYMSACTECAAVFQTLESMIQSLSKQLDQSTQQINQNIDTTRSNILDELNSVKNAIVSAIEKQSAAQQQLQQSDLNYKAAQSMAKSGADADDKFTAESADNMDPNSGANACATMSTASATTSAAQSAQLTARALAATGLRKHLYTSNAGEVMRKVLEDHNQNFCSAEDAKRGRCGSNGSTTVSADMQNANLSAGSLMAPSGGQSYNDNERKAALAYIDNVIGPIPQEALPIAVERTAAGQRYVIEDRAINSARSMASYSLNQIFANHSAEDPNGSTPEGKISVVGMMKKFVEERYGDPTYRTKLSTMGMDGVMRDIAMSMAFQNWMDYYAYLQGERTEGLLATTLAMNARERSERVLPALRAQATQSLK